MPIGNPMTLRSQIAIVLFVSLGIGSIVYLLYKRKINESLFYLWLIVFIGVLMVGVSRRVQLILTTLIGSYSPLSSMLLFSLSFLFFTSLIYSILISSINSKLRDIISYVAQLRLDLDELKGSLSTRPSIIRDEGQNGESEK